MIVSCPLIPGKLKPGPGGHETTGLQDYRTFVATFVATFVEDCAEDRVL
jgi:hypothetical protein